VQVSLRSIAAQDGVVVESSATSSVGGGAVPVNEEIHLGDQASGRQFKAIVSFDTSGIPDGAVIVAATLRLRRVGVYGENPFETFGTCRIDVHTSFFGDGAALVPSDFEAPATASAAGVLGNAPANGSLSVGDLGLAGRAAIDRAGTTQLRLAFDLGDDGDGIADRMRYVAGDVADPSLRPELLITYQQ
jgi:hypothetical protein